jgi:hypothetical protein
MRQLNKFLNNTKTGDYIVSITSRVVEAIEKYILYIRKPKK